MVSYFKTIIYVRFFFIFKLTREVLNRVQMFEIFFHEVSLFSNTSANNEYDRKQICLEVVVQVLTGYFKVHVPLAATQRMQKWK